MHNCGMHNCYKHVILFFSLCTSLPHLHYYVKKHFVHIHGITLPLPPVSILYLHVSVLCLLFVFNFIIITDLLLLILPHQDSVLHLSLLIVLAYYLNWSASFYSAIFWHLSHLAFAYPSKVILSPMPWTVLGIGWKPSWVMCIPTVFGNCYLFLFCLWYCSPTHVFMASNSLFYYLLLPLLTLLSISISTFQAHDYIYSLVISFTFLAMATSLIFSVIILSWFMSFTNCPFNLLSFCHNHIYLPLFWGGYQLLSIFYFAIIIICSIKMINMVLLCCCLNLLLNALNVTVLVLHFNFSSSFRVFITLSPSWACQFSIIGTMSLTCTLKVFITKWSLLISMLHNS